MDSFIRNSIEKFTSSYDHDSEIGWKTPLVA